MQSRGAAPNQPPGRFFPHVPLRCLLVEFTEFVDLSALTAEMGFCPSEPIAIAAKWAKGGFPRRRAPPPQEEVKCGTVTLFWSL